MITGLIAMATLYGAGGLSTALNEVGLAHQVDPFGGLDEFVYTIDAPAYVKQLANKEVEEDHEFSNVDENFSGVRIKASHVKLHFKTTPLQSGTKIIFDVLAEDFEFNGMGYNAKKRSAEIQGYGILNEEMSKLTLHVPWAEIMKNL